MENITQKSVIINSESVTVPAKPWYMSKTIWIGIILTVSSIFEFLATKYAGITVFGTIAGILVIISRFSSTTAIQ